MSRGNLFVFLKGYLVSMMLLLHILCSVDGQQQRNCVFANKCEAAWSVSQKYKEGKVTPQEMDGLRNSYCFHVDGRPKINCEVFKTFNHPKRPLLPEQCGYVDGNRIVGGKTADVGEFPWMALISIQRSGGPIFACGGSIINNRYILTAAHCVHNKEILGVRIGEYDLEKDDDCQPVFKKIICTRYKDIEVESVKKHDEYINENNRRMHDLALIRVKNPIDFSDTKVRTAAVCLPTSPREIMLDLDGRRSVVAGWGITEKAQESTVLMKVEVPINSAAMCFNSFEANHVQARFRTNTSTFICAGVAGKDSCRRDSGGPLMVVWDHGGYSRYVQYGIVSFGPEDCGNGRPGLYTDIALHISWIMDNLKP